MTEQEPKQPELQTSKNWKQVDVKAFGEVLSKAKTFDEFKALCAELKEVKDD